MKRMTPVLNELGRSLKSFVVFVVIFTGMQYSLHAALPEPSSSDAPSSLSVSAVPKQRNVFLATYDDGLDIATAPIHWTGEDWAIAGVSVGAIYGLTQADPYIYSRIRGRQLWLDTSMPLATDMADALYAVPATALLWGVGEAFGEERLADTSSSAMESLAFCGAASVVLKYPFAGDRPDGSDQTHRFFDYNFTWGSPSFPSGHTLVAFALAEVYGDAYGRWWTYPLAAVIGYSRVYLGAHWPSDVAAGALIGSLMGHECVVAQHQKGAPRAWKFTMGPNDNGGVMAMAQCHY
jgi:membrane-associated phospholipid phosphatase